MHRTDKKIYILTIIWKFLQNGNTGRCSPCPQAIWNSRSMASEFRKNIVWEWCGEHWDCPMNICWSCFKHLLNSINRICRKIPLFWFRREHRTVSVWKTKAGSIPGSCFPAKTENFLRKSGKIFIPCCCRIWTILRNWMNNIFWMDTWLIPLYTIYYILSRYRIKRANTGTTGSQKRCHCCSKMAKLHLWKNWRNLPAYPLPGIPNYSKKYTISPPFNTDSMPYWRKQENYCWTVIWPLQKYQMNWAFSALIIFPDNSGQNSGSRPGRYEKKSRFPPQQKSNRSNGCIYCVLIWPDVFCLR